MSIRSIDMQVLVQKVADVAKVQQAQQLETSNRQQESAQQISQQTNIDVKTVNQPLKNQNAYVHEKQEKKDDEKKSKTKKGNSEKKENRQNNTVNGSNNSNHLDIIV